MANPTLLIVDDEAAGRASLESVLLTQGYHLVFASSGAEALRLAHDLLPDVILLDVMLPDLDGFEVCRRLRADALVGEVPVVMVTALDDRASRLRGLEAGADDFVSKPIDRAELRARVKSIIRLNRYRRLQDERAKLERQLEETTRRTAELEFLARISSEMRSVQERSALMQLLVDQMVSEFQAQAGAMALMEGSTLIFHAASGRAQPWQQQRLPRNEGIFWQSIESGETVVEVKGIHCEPGANRMAGLPCVEGIGSGLLSMLKSGPTTNGVMFIGFAGERTISEDQKRLAVTVSEVAGHALQRMRVTEELRQLVQYRTRELESIYKVTSAASESLDISRTFQKALELVVSAINAPHAAIFLLNENSSALELIARVGFSGAALEALSQAGTLEGCPERQVLDRKEPLVLPDLSTSPGEYTPLLAEGMPVSYTGFPLHNRDTVVGVLAILRPGGALLSADEMTLVSFIADHLGLIVENRRLYQQAEHNAILEERSRLARDLHDSVTQLLYSAALFSTGTKKYISQGKLEPAVQYLDQIEQVTQQALREMRLMVFELRAPAAHTLGLVGEIKNRLDAVERRSGISAVFHASELPPISGRVEDSLFRVVTEALNNSLKHAFASNVDVTVGAENGSLHLQVQDNGVGFSLSEGRRSGGLGLASMQERVEQMGGTLHIDSAPGQGTRISVEIPIGERGWQGSLHDR